jgi:histidinol phosphatase-like enzyme
MPTYGHRVGKFMKAVFVHKRAVLRDSHIDPSALTEAWHLVPATLEAMRHLAAEDTLVFLYDFPLAGTARAPEEERSDHGLQALVKQIADAGGRVDGYIACGHVIPQECIQPEAQSNALWVVGDQFDLKLSECYVLGDSAQDVETAYRVGARPLLLLGSRSIGRVLGNQPEHKDYPIALDLTTAVNYIDVEEEAGRQLGHSRQPAVSAPPREALYAQPQALPAVTLTSPLANEIRARMSKARTQLADVRRWLSFLVIGAVGLALGIAYLLTHLYRMQPFPEFAYYITLQFIPRPLRGALFILWGVGVIWITVRSFYRALNLNINLNFRRKGKT